MVDLIPLAFTWVLWLTQLGELRPEGGPSMVELVDSELESRWDPDALRDARLTACRLVEIASAINSAESRAIAYAEAEWGEDQHSYYPFLEDADGSAECPPTREGVPPERVRDRQVELARRIIAELREQGVIAELEALSHLDALPPGTCEHLPKSPRLLGSARRAASVLLAVARFEYTNGNDRAAVDLLGAALRFSRLIEGQQGVIASMIASSSIEKCADSVRIMLNHRIPDGRTLDSMASLLAGPALLRPVGDGLRLEASMLDQVLGHSFTEPRRGGVVVMTALGTRFVFSSPPEYRWLGFDVWSLPDWAANLGGLFLARREEALDVLQKHYAGLADWLDHPPCDRANADYQPSAALEGVGVRHPLVIIILEVIGSERLERAVDAGEHAIRRSRVYVAIERYRADHGRLPSTLDELVPQYLGRVPCDWFSPDRRFVYRLIAEDTPDPLGRDYLLYSVGRDGVDNGGNFTTKHENQRSLYRGEEELDFVIRRPVPAQPVNG